MKKRNICNEFVILRKITFTNKHMGKLTQETSDEVKEKNRYDHIIPFAHSMPTCSCPVGIMGFNSFFSQD